MRPKTLLIRSGRVYDPLSDCDGEVRDIAVCGERIVAPDAVADPDEIVDASGMVVTAAAVDCAAHVAFPGAWALQAAGLFPDIRTYARRYAERGFAHVHESWAPLTHLGTVRGALERMGGLDFSIGLCVPLDDLISWIEAHDPGTAQRVLDHLSRIVATRGFYLPEPRLRFRNEVYKHREKSAQDILPFLCDACAGLEGRLAVPFRSFLPGEVSALCAGVHLHRATDYERTNGTKDSFVLSHLLRPELTGDLGVAWPEKNIQLTWVPPEHLTKGPFWDVGTYLLLKASPLPEEDFRDNAEILRFMAQAVREGWAFSCRHASLALVEGWTGLVRAVLEVLSVRDWLLATRGNAAKALGLGDRGHLRAGARANVALFREPAEDTPASWAEAFSRCEQLYVGGTLIYQAQRGLCPSSPIPGRKEERAETAVSMDLMAPFLVGTSLRLESFERLGPGPDPEISCQPGMLGEDGPRTRFSHCQ